jgi:hypothetical protein
MKNYLLPLLAALLATSSVRAALILNTEDPTIGSTNTTFNFNLFNSDLGTLTAVDLLFNSSTAGGSVSVDTNTSGESALFSSMTSFVRTSGTGLSQQNTTPVTISLNPGLPNNQPADTFQTYNVTGTQSLISSVQTYSINPVNWASYQTPGGVGNTPNFTGRAFTTPTFTADVLPTFSNSLYAAVSSYTLRYTYTPAGPSPVPEPGQVAASLLLLGGIGTYFLIKRRRSSSASA